MATKEKELEGHVASLRSAIRDMLPVLDWVDSHTRTDAKHSDIRNYANSVGDSARKALEESTPMDELAGSPLDDVAELATLIGIKQNEPGIWDMGMQARLDELVERWKR